MKYTTHIFSNGDILTHDNMNNIISGIDEAKLEITSKQNTLESGKNIKTINGIDILGAGNISISGSNSTSDLYEEAKKLISRFSQQTSRSIKNTDEKVVDIVLFAGQSNSCGRATLSDCSTSEDIILNVPFNKAFSFNNTSSSTPVQITEPISANGSSAYGYIPAFINAYYASTNRKICACYCSKGGVMLNKFAPYVLDDTTGQPTSTQGSFYKSMVTAVTHAKTNLASSGYTVGDVFMVWCQGESDADYLGNTNNYANAYEATLVTDEQKITYYKEQFTNLVSHLKNDVNLSTAFIIRIGHKRGTTNSSYAPIIRAQNELGRENDDCVLVSTIFAGANVFKEEDGSIRNLMRDNWHYLPEGYLRAGLEAGVNAGIYVNSNKMTKPILLEYNTLFVDDSTPYERSVDKFIYDPNRIDLNYMRMLAKDSITYIYTNTPSATIGVGSNTQLTYTVYPTIASNKNVTFTSSDPTVAVVSPTGVVTGVAAGSTTITITSEQNTNVSATVVIEVSNSIVPVTEISLNTTSTSASVGSTLQLVATVLPADASNKNILWTTSDASTAEVTNDGLVTIMEQGDVTITATSAADTTKYATCNISAYYKTEPSTPILDLDFTAKTMNDYVTDGVIIIPEGSVTDDITYDDSGMVCADNSLVYGLKLVNPIDTTTDFTIELTTKVSTFADSGTTNTEANWGSIAIISGEDINTFEHTHGTACLTPALLDNKGALKIYNKQMVNTSRTINSVFLKDGLEHTYKFISCGTACDVYRDGTFVGTTTFDESFTGNFGYILGIHSGYNYAKQYSLKRGYSIKTFKVYK